MAPDPTFRAALPQWLHDALRPSDATDDALVDVTPLVVEFAFSLDPAGSACVQAPRILQGDDWKLVGECAVSASLLRTLREVAGDPRIVRAVADRYPGLVDRKAGTMKPRALPVLLGIAAAAAVGLRAGKLSAAVARRAARELRSERQRSDDGSPAAPLVLQSPSLGGKPQLAPLPDDLAAE